MGENEGGGGFKVLLLGLLISLVLGICLWRSVFTEKKFRPGGDASFIFFSFPDGNLPRKPAVLRYDVTPYYVAAVTAASGAPMITAVITVVICLMVIVWSADRFVDGAAAIARHFAIPPLLIGIVIVGFGTSAPELLVSAIAASQGNPGIALGNAYGSNIANIALILGITAMVVPISVHSQVLRKELPILTAVTALAAWQLRDGTITRPEAALLLGVFAALMGWSILQGMRKNADTLGSEMEKELQAFAMPLHRAFLWLFTGLILLIVISRVLVWGAVDIAHRLGVSDLLIGLTVVAVGTSLPELASSLAATRKGEHDIALGNVLGSNLFNTLVVVGIAGVIHPMTAGSEVLARDVPVMGILTLSLFVIGFGFRKPGRINRIEGAILLVVYAGYTAYLVSSAFIR